MSHNKNLDLSAELGGETLLLHILHGSFTPEQVDGGTRREETLMLLPLQRLKNKPVDTVTVTQHWKTWNYVTRIVVSISYLSQQSHQTRGRHHADLPR